MTRKDTILIAVIINAGLLAVLFTTAVIYDTDRGREQMEFFAPIAENKIQSTDSASRLIAVASTGDEVDNVLKYYNSPAPQPIVVKNQPEKYPPQLVHLPSSSGDERHVAESIETDSNKTPAQEGFIEMTVKRGDVLEKIARANKTTVGAIKRANQLEDERLSIGQVLKIPLKENSSLSTTGLTTAQSEFPRIEQKAEVKEPKAAEPIYYTVKSGDNPWKIAKQFGVKYDEILRLNSLDEEKARNLKIGDRIRIK